MTPNTATAPTIGLSIEQVDPTTLGVLDQARGDATPDDELVDSVRKHGIMQPPTVAYDPEHGGYVIVMGHRRVGAAIAAGLKTITVLVRDHDVDPDDVKLGEQIVENERRKALSASELAQGYKRLELFGRTPEDIAAQLGEKPDRIRAGLRIAGSEKTTALVDAEPTINLEQAAIIAEFDDHPKLQERLVTTATQRPANFSNDVYAVRKEQELQTALAELKATAKETGVPIAETLTYHGGSYWSGREGMGLTIEKLADQNGAQLTHDTHKGCPGEAIIITGAWSIDNLTTIDVCTSWELNGHQKLTPNVGQPRERTQEELDRDAEWERQNAERAAARLAHEENTRARREWIHGFIAGRLNQTAGIFDLMALGLITAPFSNQESLDAATTVEILTLEKPANWEAGETALLDMISKGKVLPLRALAAAALAQLENSIHYPWASKYLTQLATWGYQLTDLDKELITTADALAAQEAADEEPADDEDGDWE